MKFFKNTLIVEDFFEKFPNVTDKYEKKAYKLIAQDFGLNKRLSNPNTIISKIEAIQNPKQYILDRLHKEIAAERQKIQEDIGLWSSAKLKTELKKVGISDFGDDNLRRKMRAHRDNSLEWEAYDADKLKGELKARHIKNDMYLEGKMYRKHAAELLDLFDMGELVPTDFVNQNTYRVFVTDKLTAMGLSTDGNDLEKQTRLVKNVLKKYNGSSEGDVQELLERLVRFHNRQERHSDMTPEYIKKSLREKGAYMDGSLEELTQRLDRFEQKKAAVDDYSDDWFKDQLRQYDAPLNGNRQNLLERYKIISLTKENQRLHKELENCRRSRRYTSSYRRESKKKSAGPGFYTGLTVGAIGSLISRRQRQVQEKATLKF